MSDKKNHKEYDAIGELFRQRLEDHQLPVDGDGWSEIERRLGKRKNKKALWLWSSGLIASAAAIALLVIVNRHAVEVPTINVVSQQVTTTGSSITQGSEAVLTDKASASTSSNKTVMSSASDASKSDHPALAGKANTGSFNNNSAALVLQTGEQVSHQEENGITDSAPIAAATGNEQDTKQVEGAPVVAQAIADTPKLDISLVEDKPDEEPDTKKNDKWLLAAAFGTGGGTSGFDNQPDQLQMDASPAFDGNNSYAVALSNNIKSFSEMTADNFSNINHNPPLSFGITARKSLGKHVGVESGLVYTYLSSTFKWGENNVDQRLHYIGIPVNMVVYLWQTKPNWQIYLSGGFMVEKGLRGVYKQVGRNDSETRTTIVKSSSIDGLQWSLNGGLGINYRFNKGLGVYFEPRVGYAFDCDQPVSMRTEYPVFFGVSMGLNYEF